MKVRRIVHSANRLAGKPHNIRTQEFLHDRFSVYPARLEFKDKGLAFDIGFREATGVWAKVFQMKVALDIKVNENELSFDEMAEEVFRSFASGLSDRLTPDQEAELSIQPQNIYAPIILQRGTGSEDDLPANRLLLTIMVRPKIS